MRILLFVAAVAIAICSTPGHAALRTWKLEGVELVGLKGLQTRAVATGWFVYDAARTEVVDWAIQIPAIEFEHPGASFASPSTGPNCFNFEYCQIAQFKTALESIEFYSQRETFHALLSLRLATGLTDNGGAVQIIPTTSTLGILAGFDFGVVSGMLTPVPEPSQLLALAFGLAALVGASLGRSHSRKVRRRPGTEIKRRNQVNRWLLVLQPKRANTKTVPSFLIFPRPGKTLCYPNRDRSRS